MKFVEIKVRELVTFINSDVFRQMPELPISSLRAQSQSLNPSANPDDTALIYAMNDQSRIVGYIGILPASIFLPEKSGIYFISCWWADPEAGRGVAMKLFFRMLELTGKSVFFFHLPEKMASILRTMGGFTFAPVMNGLKGFIRMDSQNWLKRRSPGLAILKPVLYVMDEFLNIAVTLRLSFIKKHLQKTSEFLAETIPAPSDSELKFISEITGKRTSFRGMEELEWVIANPWISMEINRHKQEAARYRFSLLASEWQQRWIKISYGNEIKGMAYLTIRDGVAAFPYLWFKPEDYLSLTESIVFLLLDLKVKAIQTYNPQLIKGIEQIKNLFLHRRSLQRIIAWPDEMNIYMQKEYLLQDGDGDAVFT